MVGRLKKKKKKRLKMTCTDEKVLCLGFASK
jgi:hypothetical protein